MHLNTDDIEVMETREESLPLSPPAKILPFVIRKMEEPQVYENEFVRPEKPVLSQSEIDFRSSL